MFDLFVDFFGLPETDDPIIVPIMISVFCVLLVYFIVIFFKFIHSLIKRGQ